MKKGFTIIELLIVIAMIGLLAGVILVSMNVARNKAQAASAMQTFKSTMPYLIECDMKGIMISPYSVGTLVCGIGSPSWPPVSNCSFGPQYIPGLRRLNATCGNIDIRCEVADGRCFYL